MLCRSADKSGPVEAASLRDRSGPLMCRSLQSSATICVVADTAMNSHRQRRNASCLQILLQQSAQGVDAATVILISVAEE